MHVLHWSVFSFASKNIISFVIQRLINLISISLFQRIIIVTIFLLVLVLIHIILETSLLINHFVYVNASKYRYYYSLRILFSDCCKSIKITWLCKARYALTRKCGVTWFPAIIHILYIFNRTCWPPVKFTAASRRSL